jgi:uncharacterized phage-associated protein
MSYDPRIVANVILDIRDDLELPTTNLELQKLLYFCHAFNLNRFREPLVSGVFEAWKNGPVNPAVYRAFKEFIRSPITKRAQSRDYQTNSYVELPKNISETTLIYLTDDIKRLSKLSAWELVELSHAPNGPWDYVVQKSKLGFAAGMRISDQVTRDKFAHIKRAVSSSDTVPSTTIVEPFSE